MRSDLFKTDTIWVARLQAQGGTSVCVSEVRRGQETERRKAENSQFTSLSCAHTLMHTCPLSTRKNSSPPEAERKAAESAYTYSSFNHALQKNELGIYLHTQNLLTKGQMRQSRQPLG